MKQGIWTRPLIEAVAVITKQWEATRETPSERPRGGTRISRAQARELYAHLEKGEDGVADMLRSQFKKSGRNTLQVPRAAVLYLWKLKTSAKKSAAKK